jgi:integrase/recombinase XerD
MTRTQRKLRETNFRIPGTLPKVSIPPSPADHLFLKLSKIDLPAKEHLESYLRYKVRLNHKPRTLSQTYTTNKMFLDFYQGLGKSRLEEVTKEDLEAFIEHEQDRGLKISTVRTRLATLTAFLHFLIEEGVISGAVLKKRIKLRLPETLPRAMNPSEVKKLLSVIDDTQERALILILLRTGIRIGEALGLTVNDLDIRERKIHLYEGEKNSRGRVVYLSDDALFALKRWLRQRDPGKECVFFTGGHARMSYSTARGRFSGHLKSAGLAEKGYSVHCLRHTFASELLNAGMRLECLQQLMGHQDIEVTRRYARLTDRTREEEYFRAMALIEKGGINGTY